VLVSPAMLYVERKDEVADVCDVGDGRSALRSDSVGRSLGTHHSRLCSLGIPLIRSLHFGSACSNSIGVLH
jgi:hypothetical protein